MRLNGIKIYTLYRENWKELETLRPWDSASVVEGDDGEEEEALTTKGACVIVLKEYLKDANSGGNEKDLR